MKKIFTLLTFVFMTSAMLFGQCADTATPNGSGSRFNMNYSTEAERNAALVGLESITFPADPNGTITILLSATSNPQISLDGPVGSGDVYRIRGVAAGSTFGGVNGNFSGDIVFNYAGSSTTCTYAAGGLLPVDLVSFDGIKRDQQINLNWQTASEINNEGFVIERGHKTASDLEWNQLDFIAGSGTAHALNDYSFTDRNPEEGINYYRLKQMDYDGGYEYSSVITVEYSKKQGSAIEIFPNPVKSELTLTNGAGEAIIYNALGQAVKHLTIDANRATIQLEGLLSGQYYIQVLEADGTMITKQFSKVD